MDFSGVPDSPTPTPNLPFQTYNTHKHLYFNISLLSLNINKQCMTSPISEIFFFNLASKSILQKLIGLEVGGYCPLYLFTRRFLSLIDLFSYHRQSLWSSSSFYHYTSHPLDSQIKDKNTCSKMNLLHTQHFQLNLDK